MYTFHILCALVLVSTQVQGDPLPEPQLIRPARSGPSTCADQGGTCVPKNSACCPERMVNDGLCNPNHRCCLAALSSTADSTTSPTSEGPTSPTSEGPTSPTSEGPTSPTSEGPTSPTSEGPTFPTSEGPTSPTSEGPTSPTSEGPTSPTSEGPSGTCECSVKHEQTLSAAQTDFLLDGSSTYFPYHQVPYGASNRNCLPREPECGDPADVCLKNRVLNLLQCAPDACNGPQGIWKLHSVLHSNTCVGTDCDNFCEGDGVLFERVNQQCGFGQLKNMCEDTGGVYEKDGQFVWCRY